MAEATSRWPGVVAALCSGQQALDEGLLLSSFHHHRPHDRRWDASRLANGDVHYARRT